MESSKSQTSRKQNKKNRTSESQERRRRGEEEEEEEEESWPRRNKVTLEGYIEAINDKNDQDQSDASSFGRTKSLTDEDLEELKGCLDLGFGFSYDEIPELCNTLPALELCYSMSQRFLDQSSDSSSDDSSLASNIPSPSSPLVANWKISSPGDDPDEVKARLKYWAQAVACTVRLCS